MVNLFSRPVRWFGNTSVVILMAVFFLIPFAMRGARMSVTRMENNVKDWLPSDFPETKDLEWFGKHFVGERFVLVTWPGCTESDQRYDLLLKKLKNELSVEDEAVALAEMTEGQGGVSERQARERLRARRIGDQHGLLALSDASSYFENWAGLGEKWLRGQREAWYYITPKGELYQWKGSRDLWGAAWRAGERMLKGHNQADGELIATLGQPVDNEFHRNPRRLGARFFKTIQAGPEVLAELSSESGPLWPRLSDVADEDKPFIARRTALERLTGSLYAPAVRSGFDWSADAFIDAVPEKTFQELPSDWETRFNSFVDRLVQQEYQDKFSDLVHASPQRQSTHWEDLFASLEIPPPPRETCIIVTLSEVGKQQLRRVIGRPLLGAPPGKLLDLAIHECKLAPEEIKLGGPPVDNVAIDEEGSITLFNLIGWSSLVGLCLSYLCFRSIRMTIMVFFVGGISAIASLSMVWWCGASVDAILMSMPSLVYVLGLAGAVHIVNYYQEAVRKQGVAGAPERALADGWGPCTLAAFTTALGLMSLYTSNLMPIKKFGLYSAIGVMLTLTLLFTYLPAALTVWPNRTRNQEPVDSTSTLSHYVELFWVSIGRWIIKRHNFVATVCVLTLIGVGLGLAKTETSVQLMKLFDPGAKVIQDYSYLEDNFGKLVPMELVIRVAPEMIKPSTEELAASDKVENRKERFKLDFLERMELVDRVQSAVESVFGAEGKDIVGQGLSAVTFAPDLPPPAAASMFNPTRIGFKTKLEENRQEFLNSDYLRLEERENGEENELWRISLRLAALKDVDYGDFLHQQKLVVEPILAAYQYREKLLRAIDEKFSDKRSSDIPIAILGVGKPSKSEHKLARSARAAGAEVTEGIEQAELFGATLYDLFTVAGLKKTKWEDPAVRNEPEAYRSEAFAKFLGQLDCLMLVQNHPHFDLDFIRENMRPDSVFIDARDHHYELGSARAQTAAELNRPIHVVYTGVVPVVYKAQGTLLRSLAKSIGLAFVMIAVVMMILLRDWRSRLSLGNIVNLPAGMVSMVPNLFPVVLIFGLMGHLNILVDIGTMMCASVAMGVAVDDTIHFLTWFRHGIRDGLDRNEALIHAYRRVATAMTQTTLIGGLGLSVFALSTFTPTQRFGVMMVTLLIAALIGDLIMLPAMLAGPLGKFFCPRSGARLAADTGPIVQASFAEDESPNRVDSPHHRSSRYRTDAQHQ